MSGRRGIEGALFGMFALEESPSVQDYLVRINALSFPDFFLVVCVPNDHFNVAITMNFRSPNFPLLFRVSLHSLDTIDCWINGPILQEATSINSRMPWWAQ